MNNSIMWDTETPVLLYGAAYQGTLVANYLKPFCNVIGFLDKRGDEILDYMGLPVEKPANSQLENSIREQSVVIVCVKNVFDHSQIVLELLKNGFRYIVFVPVETGNISIDKESDAFLKISMLFDNIDKKTLQLPQEVPAIKGLLKQKWGDEAKISENGSSITAYIPAPLIFTDKVDNGNPWGDTPLLMLYPHLEFDDYLDGETQASNKTYIEDFCAPSGKLVGDFEQTDRWKSNVFDNRRMVYEQMELSFELDHSFFERNAPAALLNEAGYFNLDSGKHRATFLAHKQTKFIPLKLDAEEYNRFVNAKALGSLKKYIETNEIWQLPFPIMHPYFYKFPCRAQQSVYRMVQTTLFSLAQDAYLRSGKIGLNSAKVVCADDRFFPLALIMQKAGCEIWLAKPLSEFQLLVAELMRANPFFVIGKAPSQEKVFDILLFGEETPVEILADMSFKYEFKLTKQCESKALTRLFFEETEVFLSMSRGGKIDG